MRWFLSLDVVAVLLFVVVGRDTHDEGQAMAAVFATAAPFLIALVLGWVVTRAWQRPVSIGVGVIVAAVTVAGGMLLRRFLFDDGTALAFVIVATVALGALLVGWRGVAIRALPARAASR